jgi:hypothetical protein
MVVSFEKTYETSVSQELTAYIIRVMRHCGPLWLMSPTLKTLLNATTKIKIPLLTEMSAVISGVRYSTTITATPLFRTEMKDAYDI